MPSFSRVLIANRGEIAHRVARAVRAEGLTPVTVHTSDDASSPHVATGDETATLPGEGPAGYLDIPAVVTAAVDHDCDAIHPGYGFLSENATFARTVQQAGLTWIGPGPDQLERFGDKVAARQAAVDAGVPVLAATAAGVDVDTARAFLGEHGSVMIKSVAGGGGRGMRPVTDPGELDAAFAACAREAESAFGDGSLYVEELLVGARHVEVQIIGDGVRVEHAHERECSLQRNRQKVVEFAPAWWTPQPVRRQMHDAAVRLGEYSSFDSIGTVEFLVARDRWAFIECNPRLQVEHTVTEAVCGIDLVRMQLRLARGDNLGALELYSSPRTDGFAVQTRINLEGGGLLSAFEPPPGHRVDTFGPAEAMVGYEPSTRYDALLAKLVVHGTDPEMTLASARQALSNFTIEGVGTNRDRLVDLLDDPDIAAGRFDTTTLSGHERFEATVPAPSSAPVEQEVAAAGDVVAPMQATVVRVDVAVGDRLPAGATVAILEAMKMEHVVTARQSGVVRAVLVAAGATVAPGDVLVELEPADVAAASVDTDEVRDLDEIRPDLAEAIERHAYGRDENRPEAVQKRRKLGKRTARENVADLLDEGSLIEYGPLVVAAQRKRRSDEELREKTPGDGLVGGIGTVRGTPVAVASYDYTVLAGTQGLNNPRQKDRLFEVAEQQRLPFVFFTEGGGGRPGDTDGTGVAGLDCLAFAYFGRLSGLVPLVGIASGRCFAGNAAILGCCDVVIATRDANIGMGGPAMIEGGGLGTYAPEDVGPIDDQIASGVVDVAVEDEAGAVAVAQPVVFPRTAPRPGPRRPRPRRPATAPSCDPREPVATRCAP